MQSESEQVPSSSVPYLVSFQDVQYSLANQSEPKVRETIDEYLNCHQNAAKPEQYVSVLQICLRRYDVNASLYNAFAYVYGKSKDYQTSLIYCNKALSLDPHNEYALQTSIYPLLLENKFVECIQNCHKLFALNSVNGKICLYCAVAHLKLGKRISRKSARLQYIASWKMLQVAESQGTKDKTLNYWVGYCLNRLGRYADAFPYLEKDIFINSPSVNARQFMLAALLSGKLPQAINDVRKLCNSLSPEQVAEIEKDFEKRAPKLLKYLKQKWPS